MIGLTRVGWVKIEVGESGPACSIVGTRRHRVVTRPVSVATATALMALGVPSVVRHRSSSRPVAVRT